MPCEGDTMKPDPAYTPPTTKIDDLTDAERAVVEKAGVDPDTLCAVTLFPQGVREMGLSEHGHLVMVVQIATPSQVIKPRRVVGAGGQNSATDGLYVAPMSTRVLMSRAQLTAVDFGEDGYDGTE